MEETFARVLQFTLAGLAAFGVALWFALAVWTFRDIERRSSSIAVQVLATLVVVLGFIPGVVIYLLLRPRDTVDQRYQREIEESYLAQELGSVPACPRCDRAIRDEFIFCPDCGTTLRRTCNSCGRLVDIDWGICAYCGHDLPSRSGARRNGRTTGRVTTGGRSRTTSADGWEVDLTADNGDPEGASRSPARPREKSRRGGSQEGAR